MVKVRKGRILRRCLLKITRPVLPEEKQKLRLVVQVDEKGVWLGEGLRFGERCCNHQQEVVGIQLVISIMAGRKCGLVHNFACETLLNNCSTKF